MTLFSTAKPQPRGLHRRHRSHFALILCAFGASAAAVALIAFLLWPTFVPGASSLPDRLPISIGGTVFNVPTAAIRMRIQRHSGAQEGINLSFAFPSLEAAETPQHPGAAGVESAIQTVDRIFLSIAAHHDEMPPEIRLQAIYPHYLEQASTPGEDGLAMRAFRDGTPYGGEDLFFANTPALSARCTRDAAIPGMCLSERRIDGADLTFRFPRSWLAQWHEVSDAMDRLTIELHPPNE
jgi:hypothetical protein